LRIASREFIVEWKDVRLNEYFAKATTLAAHRKGTGPLTGTANLLVD